MSTLSTTVRRGLVVTAAAMAAGPVVGGVASAATGPTTGAPLDAAPITTTAADVAQLATAPLPMTPSALPLAGGLGSIMPINGDLAAPVSGLAGGLPLNQLTGGLPVSGLTGGLPVSGLAGQLPVVGPMTQNLPVVGRLTEATPAIPPANAQAAQDAAADLKAAFPAPHMPTPQALMTPAHPGKRSRTIAPAVTAPAGPTAALVAHAQQAVAAANRSSTSLPIVGQLPTGQLPVVGGLTQGLPVGNLTGLLGKF